MDKPLLFDMVFMILMERTLFELKNNISDWEQARRQLNWIGGGHG